METRSWSDLPSELLPSVAKNLGIIELLGFRGVCKDWKTATLEASAEVESSPDHKPWFLLYGDTSTCTLLSNSSKKYTLEIAELDEATCLASNQGWLLLLQNSSPFFFCPFSRVEIRLPELSLPEFSDHVAAFSSPPTSQDCVVVVFSRDLKSDQFIWSVLSRGEDKWKTVNYPGPTDKVTCGAYSDGKFYFFDCLSRLVIFKPEDETWYRYMVRESARPRRSSSDNDGETLPFHFRKSWVEEMDVKKKLGLEEGVSLSTCGTLFKVHGCDIVVFNEEIQAGADSENHHVKGVWIHPRFFQVSPNQSW